MHDALPLYFKDDAWQIPRGALAYDGLHVVRGDLFHVHAQRETPADFSDVATGLFALKKSDALAGDFAAAFAGFDADEFQDLATARLSIAAAIPTELELGQYLAALIVFDDVGNPRHLGNSLFPLTVDPPLYTGAETNLPIAITGRVTAIAEITGSDLSVTVALPGMTATGCVLVTPLLSTGGFVQPQISYGTDQFTITVPSAPEIEPGDGRTFRFQWWLRWKA